MDKGLYVSYSKLHAKVYVSFLTLSGVLDMQLETLVIRKFLGIVPRGAISFRLALVYPIAFLFGIQKVRFRLSKKNKQKQSNSDVVSFMTLPSLTLVPFSGFSAPSRPSNKSTVWFLSHCLFPLAPQSNPDVFMAQVINRTLRLFDSYRCPGAIFQDDRDSGTPDNHSEGYDY